MTDRVDVVNSPASMDASVRAPDLGVVGWLFCVALLILVMVGVGGITRLTGSGLSIVEWDVVMGTLPPLNQAQWEEAFQQYQDSPQYQLQNQGMSLEAFKGIFFWEYVHRLLGRMIGFVFLIPYLYFLVRRRIQGALTWKLAGVFVLGGLQGALGWFMVQSGLVDKPYVSHFRLAAHLLLAFALYAFLVWIILDLLRPGRRSARPGPAGSAWKSVAIAFTAVLVLQTVYGAFMAGMKAGYTFNTWPTMLGYWVPPGLFALSPWMDNLFWNVATIHFIHRGLAWILAFGALAMWIAAFFSPLQPRQRFLVHALFGATILQFLLGVMTLLAMVPIALATLHQVTACYLFGVGFGVIHAFQYPDPVLTADSATGKLSAEGVVPANA